ncbi:unnamed protein product [Pseudo-nitzschia multistriata]|uniref:Pectinesterase inhibitor domain-containing protein n=1 Tax=Pseudo-nitzschia multistriata TaxID=183589 RepID=A0A448ZFY5_9STRA|nr:unnamed protein product [Pseudo-nitzschia multistriata]
MASHGNTRRQTVNGLALLTVATLLAVLSSSPSAAAFATGPALPQQRLCQQQQKQQQQQHRRPATTSLRMAPPGSSVLKPAAGPLMDSGKALARSGELLIDFTRTLDLYGGALSNAGAQIRNAGDSLAQAGASCRFKTGLELVIDELREAAACLSEATDKLELATEEASADGDPLLEEKVAALVGPSRVCAARLEQAGAGLLMRQGLPEVGAAMVDAAGGMGGLSAGIGSLAEARSGDADGTLSAQRMAYAAERLGRAGTELKGEVDPAKKPEGRAFLKGGGF